MNFGRFCESGFWMAKVAMNRMSEGNTFYGRKLHITSYVVRGEWMGEGGGRCVRLVIHTLLCLTVYTPFTPQSITTPDHVVHVH